jgi:hypothetical protein
VRTTLLTLLFILAGQASGTPTYRNKECSYSFEYPRDWQIVKNPDYVTGECSATLRPADYSKRMAEFDVDVSTLTVEVLEHPFLDVAADHGFDFDGSWIVKGRTGYTDEARVQERNGWLVLRGTASIGCFHNGGGYAGICEEYRVVARYKDDDRIVAIVGGPQTESSLELVLRSFKLLQ